VRPKKWIYPYEKEKKNLSWFGQQVTWVLPKLWYIVF